MWLAFSAYCSSSENQQSRRQRVNYFTTIYIVYGYKREIDAVDYGEIFLQFSYKGSLSIVVSIPIPG